jgi:hypothetical protein
MIAATSLVAFQSVGPRPRRDAQPRRLDHERLSAGERSCVPPSNPEDRTCTSGIPEYGKTSISKLLDLRMVLPWIWPFDCAYFCWSDHPKWRQNRIIPTIQSVCSPRPYTRTRLKAHSSGHSFCPMAGSSVGLVHHITGQRCCGRKS